MAAHKTQLSPTSALPMGRYGSFAGKTAAATGTSDVTPVIKARRARRWRSDKFRRRRGPN